MRRRIQEFTETHMMRGGRWIPARLQASLALLEKLRDHPSLLLTDHLASKGSSGLESHETYGKRVHACLNLQPINKNHGRRSSNLQDWGQTLLDIVKDAGFLDASSIQRDRIINEAQGLLAIPLRSILEQEPLEVRLRGRSAECVIGDVLDQAGEKGKCGDVAQYLVGAKLRLRFKGEIPALPANKGDRTSISDRTPRAGDFHIEDAVIEVAVGLPDDKHLTQVAEALEVSDREVWLLTRIDRVDVWRSELLKVLDADIKRVVVTSVETFVGQNITELGQFSTKAKAESLKALFDIYNQEWIEAVGAPGIRILYK